MKQHYRNFILAILLCLTAGAAQAIGHTVSITNIINASCFNTCNGTATAVVSGGTGPFSYSWAPTAQTTSAVNNLCAGVYTVTVTDQADNSTATATCVIGQPAQLTLTTGTVTPATCNACNGGASVIASGGVAPFTYSWSPCCGFGPSLSNVCSGTYACTITDSNGCFATQTVNIPNSSGPNLTGITAGPAVICNGQTSLLTPTVNGGTAPFTYSWSNPNNSLDNPTLLTPTASPTVTTAYTFTVTDANSCSASGTVTVTVNPPIVANITSVDPTCNQSNGSLTANITQAAPPFTLAWSSGHTTAVVNNLAAGAYTVTVTDANGCTAAFSAGLNNIGGPTVTTNVSDAGCTNSSNGSAMAIVTGIAPFTYSWNTVPAQTTAIADSLAVGNYLVTVTDSAGCISIAPAQVNALSGNLYMYASWSGSANCNQATGSAYTYVSGGAQPYSYLWSNGDTTAAPGNLLAGVYNVTVADANGCTSAGSVAIPVTCVNYVMGRVYLDINQDTVYNAGDFPLPGIMLYESSFGYYCVTDANGQYVRSIGYSGTADFSLATSIPLYQYETPVSGHHIVTFPTLGDTAFNIDFAMSTSLPFQDLYLSMASGPARPGFTQTYSIYCENRGTMPVSDTIWFRHDSILSLISASPAFDGYTHPEGYWTFSNFAPGTTISKTIIVQVPTIPNGGYIGRQLIANARIEPISSDSTSSDNGDDEVDIITASFDPNLKECWSPTMNSTGDIWPTDITLDYTIHFQNSGTDTAFTVVVVDTLPAELDITTFRIGASSHPCTYSIDGHNDTNIVTFTFMNILLPDSNRNEPASHGYVQFTIDRDPNLPIGSTIENEAHNYFDFNPAVVTNMNVVTVSNPLTVTEPAGTGFAMYPNPAQDNVNIVLAEVYSGKTATVVLRDISGREISRRSSNGSTVVNFSLEMCSAGVYFITIESADAETITQKLIVQAK